MSNELRLKIIACSDQMGLKPSDTAIDNTEAQLSRSPSFRPLRKIVKITFGLNTPTADHITANLLASVIGLHGIGLGEDPQYSLGDGSHRRSAGH